MTEHSIQKERSWLLPQQRDEVLKPGLYIIATPIGNLRDMSFRALDTLAAADAVLCEDTRVTGKLLRYFGIKAKLEVYNDHAEDGKKAAIAKRIEGGAKLALVSDAGMPLVSDPGYKLVEELRGRGLYVTSIPGPNAPLAALQLSGLPSDKFSFLGFLPVKSGARQALLHEWAGVNSTLIAFETAPRLLKALADLHDIYPVRRVRIVREITKLYEEVQGGTASELITYYNENGLPKGEIVLVIAPPDGAAPDETIIRDMLAKALKSMRTKEAAQFVASQTGAPVKELYDLALVLKDEGV